MPNTTKLGLPYPALSDAPNVPQHMQSLASTIDSVVPRIQYGVASLTPVANTMSSFTVIFPVAFSGTPSVVVSAVTTSSAVTNASVSDITSTGCTLWLLRSNTVTTNLQWIAVR